MTDTQHGTRATERLVLSGLKYSKHNDREFESKLMQQMPILRSLQLLRGQAIQSMRVA
jgi:hypothetical protein